MPLNVDLEQINWQFAGSPCIAVDSRDVNIDAITLCMESTVF